MTVYTNDKDFFEQAIGSRAHKIGEYKPTRSDEIFAERFSHQFSGDPTTNPERPKKARPTGSSIDILIDQF
jgi:hypothetical protein